MPKAQYRVSLRQANDNYAKSANSIVEALSGLDPFAVKTKVVLTIQYKKLKAEMFMYPHSLRKLLINPTSQEIFQKRMLGALK